ncbi:hypothetical protein ElyMa_004179100 [Elysia marginata]|uniref:Uncharacterized protein n=1 Tax=Elysia marginata TaxID=1093978 RepID=A0AAV4GLS9_9GAST|nr:hypothetical protein ElyMa_004179100 [Elysia marginata]
MDNSTCIHVERFGPYLGNLFSPSSEFHFIYFRFDTPDIGSLLCLEGRPNQRFLSSGGQQESGGACQAQAKQNCHRVQTS